MIPGPTMLVKKKSPNWDVNFFLIGKVSEISYNRTFQVGKLKISKIEKEINAIILPILIIIVKYLP